MKIYHQVYENENGKWCVSYSEDGVEQISCFDSNEEAVNFYMS